MKNFGKSLFVKGSLGERWSAALKDPAWWLTVFVWFGAILYLLGKE
jgi:hypothetical protein